MNVSSSTTPSVQSTPRTMAVQPSRPQNDMQAQPQKPQPTPAASQASNPVINAQGQTTGKLLNVTA
jgi:hypothetical protein